MIFPGMDPYLEEPILWPGVHTRMIVYFCDALQPMLSPRYIAAIEERVFVEGITREPIPDVWIKHRKKRNGAVAVMEADEAVVINVPGTEIHETYVTILDRHANQKVVAVIELVSPTNKYPGPGRDSYLSKQKEIRQSTAHLIEIDLLRKGPHVLSVPEWAARKQEPYHYLVCVNRAKGERAEFGLYPRTLPQRLPKIAIPLAGDDPEAVLDVQTVLEKVYNVGMYNVRINYQSPCLPRLSREEQAWADRLVKKAFKGNGAKRKRR